jgi:hypothetical protein
MGLQYYLSKRREKRINKTCLQIYNKTKKKRPSKNERDLLKIVLLTKPPFDYQHDKVIEGLLDSCKNITELSKVISDHSKLNDPLWKNRERNLKYSNLKERNQNFFREFWSQ